MTSGSRKASVTALFKVSKIFGGRFAGPNNPNQPCALKPGYPDSATVGTSGVTAERLAPVIAKTFKRPLVTLFNEVPTELSKDKLI